MSENLKFFLMFGDIYQFFGKKVIFCVSRKFSFQISLVNLNESAVSAFGMHILGFIQAILMSGKRHKKTQYSYNFILKHIKTDWCRDYIQYKLAC